MSTDRARQAAGQPTGGQFAATAGTDAGVSLAQAGQFDGMTPIQVDEIGAATYGELVAARGKRERAMLTLREYVNMSRAKPADQVLEAARAKVEGDKNRYFGGRMQRELDIVDATTATIESANARLTEVEDEWRERGRWPRAFMVVGGGNGHVHSSMDCSTCNRVGKPTQFQWMTDYSGSTESQIVADAGYRACTVCYPTAPVGTAQSLPTKMFSEADRARDKARDERSQRAHERAEKAKAAGLTEDGSPLVVPYVAKNSPGYEYDPETRTQQRVIRDRQKHQEFKTERTAITWYTDYALMRKGAAADYEPVFTAVEEAIAAKHGKTVEQVREELIAKAKKKNR